MGDAAKKIAQSGTAELWLVDIGTGKVYPLRDGFRVGRTEGDLVLSGDTATSSRHCVFYVSGNALQIEDLGSRNGTFVGGQRIEPNKRLGLLTGAKVAIGNTQFEVQVGGAPPAARPTALDITSLSSQMMDLSELPKSSVSWTPKSSRGNSLAFQPGDVVSLFPERVAASPAARPSGTVKTPTRGTATLSRPVGLTVAAGPKARSAAAAYVFLMVNLAAFAWSMSKGVSAFDPSPEALVAVGGSLNSLTTGGQWWRLLTSIFQHAGVAHLASNMFVLLFVGVPVARATGVARFSLVYLATGLLGALASLAFNAPNLVSVGASGSLFGVVGTLLALQHLGAANAREIGKFGLASTAVFVIRNIGIGVQGIDVAAHVGGLLGGLALGYFLFAGAWEKDRKRAWLGLLAAVILLPLAAVAVPHRAAPPPPSQFGQRMNEVSTMLGRLETEYKDSLQAAKTGKIPQDEFLKLMRGRIILGIDTAAKVAASIEAIYGPEQAAKAAQLKSIGLWRDQLGELGALLETKDDAHLKKLEELQREAAVANGELDKAIAALKKPRGP